MPIQLYPKKPRIRSNCYASARAQYRVIAERQNLPERRLNGDDSLGGDQLTEVLRLRYSATPVETSEAEGGMGWTCSFMRCQ